VRTEDAAGVSAAPGPRSRRQRSTAGEVSVTWLASLTSSIGCSRRIAMSKKVCASVVATRCRASSGTDARHGVSAGGHT
jgi:hypothetical protein